MKCKYPICNNTTGVYYKIINDFIYHHSEKDHFYNVLDRIRISGKLIFKKYRL